MSVCEHEPSVAITAGQSFLESVICACRRCGELVSFPVTVPPHRPPLSLVPPLDASPGRGPEDTPTTKGSVT